MGNKASKQHKAKEAKGGLLIIGTSNVGKTTIFNAITLDKKQCESTVDIEFIALVRKDCCWYVIILFGDCNILRSKTDATEPDLCINQDMVHMSWFKDVKFALDICCDEWVKETSPN